MTTSPYLTLLRNHIDITHVPFSDRGSRLLVFKVPGQSQLYVKLAERLTELQPDIEAYLRRPPLIRDFCFIDEAGEILDFEVESFPHVLYFQTRLGGFGLAFQNSRTLTFGLPPNVTAGVRFHVSPQFWEETEFGGVFKSIRNLAYTSNGIITQNRIIPDKGGYTVEIVIQAREDDAIALTFGHIPDRPHELLPFSASSAAAESRWQAWFSRVPPVAEPFRRTYAYAWWVMANNLISPRGNVAYEAMTPSKISYVGLWLWDSAMHALAYRHVDPELARNQIRAMLSCQLPDGMLPDAVYDEAVESIARPGIPGAQGFEDDQGLFELPGPLDSPLKTEVPFHPAKSDEPIKHEIALRMDRSLVCFSDPNGRHAAHRCLPLF